MGVADRVAQAVWIENDLDGAMESARSKGTFLIAWWTAGWCPPCNEMRAAIFEDPRFGALAQTLTLARLDGDAPGAQGLADRLMASSYPTPILMSPDGRERLRMPGGLTAAEFCELLSRAIAHHRGIDDMASALQRDEPLADDDIHLLAHHWWSVDGARATGPARTPLLRKLLARCPPRMASQRLRILVHGIWGASRNAAEAGAEPWADAADFLRDMLRSGRTYSELYQLLVGPDNLAFVAAAGPVREALDQALEQAAHRLIEGGGLTHTERLISLMAAYRLRARRMGEADARTALRDIAVAAVEAADRDSASTTLRQTTMNMGGHLLRAVGEVERAEALFRAEAERSPHGPYFMGYLADIAASREESGAALQWLERGWRASPAGAARFSRGVSYVLRMRELGADRALRDRTAVELLSELAGAPDAFQGVNRTNLRRLFTGLRG